MRQGARKRGRERGGEGARQGARGRGRERGGEGARQGARGQGRERGGEGPRQGARGKAGSEGARQASCQRTSLVAKKTGSECFTRWLIAEITSNSPGLSSLWCP